MSYICNSEQVLYSVLLKKILQNVRVSVEVKFSHLAINPGPKFGNVGVNTRYILASAAYSPRYHASEKIPVGVPGIGTH